MDRGKNFKQGGKSDYQWRNDLRRELDYIGGIISKGAVTY